MSKVMLYHPQQPDVDVQFYKGLPGLHSLILGLLVNLWKDYHFVVKDHDSRT
jgi:hypothetical protein